MAFHPFQDEQTVITVVNPMNDKDGMTAQNRMDRVTITGAIDITNDIAGLRAVEQLKAIVDRIHDDLKTRRADLPKKIAIAAEEVTGNPFEPPR